MSDQPYYLAALPLVAWSRVWSPITPDPLRLEAWDALELPQSYESVKTEYWSTFQMGSPIPEVPLLLHAALNMEGDHARTDWIRVIDYLGLEWNHVHLPPDQLGVACEIYACAIQSEEPILIQELRERYFLPWCQFAKLHLMNIQTSLLFLPESFEQDLLAIPTP